MNDRLPPCNDEEVEAALEELLPTPAHKMRMLKTLFAVGAVQAMWGIQHMHCMAAQAPILLGALGCSIAAATALIHRDQHMLIQVEKWPPMNEYEETEWMERVKKSIEDLYPKLCEKIS